MTKTLTLTDFLLARIAEDEAAAKSATEHSGANWGVDYNAGPRVAVITTDERFRDAYRGERGYLWDWEGGYIGCALQSASHIARHDPARVLAECEAKRRIVARHHDGGAFGWCAECDGHPPCETLRDLASVYADHEDFQQEWRP